MYIIAEIGQAHDGSIGIAHSYIDALAYSGINAVKFQIHIAEAESSIHEKFRIPFSYKDKSRYDYWKRMEFTPEEWKGLKVHCEDLGLEFLGSPFSIKAVDLLETLEVKKYKIGSGELTNSLLIDKIINTGKELIISTGLGSMNEIDHTIKFLKGKNVNVSLLQCTTSYPTSCEEWGLNLIPEFIKRYQIPIGFSDHSGDIYACLAATSLGAEIIEFHVAFDKKMFGPDSTSSLTIEQVNMLVDGVRQITTSLSIKSKKVLTPEIVNLKNNFGKSLSLNKNKSAGEKLFYDDLESKKPAGLGASVEDYKNFIGKKIKHDKNKWDFLNYEDVE